MALIKCIECGRDISDAAVACPGCGYPLKPNTESSRAPADAPQPDTAKRTSGRRLPPPSPPPSKRGYFWLVVLLGLAGILLFIGHQTSTSTSTSSKRGTVTYGLYPKSSELTKADIAWHALNTGWNCDEVLSRDEMTTGPYYIVTCSSGLQLRVYPRPGAYPKITNLQGTYK